MDMVRIIERLYGAILPENRSEFMCKVVEGLEF